MSLRLVTGRWRGLEAAALYRDRQLQDLAVDPAGAPPHFQSIWRARIGRIVPGLGAFVDLGDQRSGLLKDGTHASGESVVVQVKSLRSEGKADIVSTDIALPGRWLIYLPMATGFRSSRRGKGAMPQTVIAALQQAGLQGGILRRTAAAAPLTDLIAEAQALRQAWLDITADARSGLLKAGPTAHERLASDYAHLDLAFETRDDLDFDDVLDRQVDLGNGASLLIERTAALTAIDVNTGQRSPGETNTLAAGEIARHIRIRNLSGLIMIDFVSEPRRAALMDKLQQALADDPAGCRIAGLTPSGLVELTRSRRAPPLAEVVS